MGVVYGCRETPPPAPKSFSKDKRLQEGQDLIENENLGGGCVWGCCVDSTELRSQTHPVFSKTSEEA